MVIFICFFKRIIWPPAWFQIFNYQPKTLIFKKRREY